MRALLSCAVVALVAGCGTTVNPSNPAAETGGPDLQGLGRPTVGPSAAGATTPQSRAPSVGSGAVGIAGASGPAGNTPPTAVGTTVQNGVPEAIGVTPNRIYVGIGYATNGDAAIAALGASGISQGREQADAKAVVDDINAHGGIAGRTLVPVWHATDATSADTWADQDQQACTAYTQDHHAFAVMGTGLTDTFNACVAKAGAVEIDSGTIIGPDQAFFDEFPNYYEVGTVSQDRMMAQLTRSLQRMDYFSGWNASLGQPAPGPAKVGILSWTHPNGTVRSTRSCCRR
jgi:hypothetical protein